MNSNPIVRAIDTAVTNAGASTVWTDPQGSAPTSPEDIALGKLAQAYGASGWVDPGGAVPTGYAERAAAHLAGGYAVGSWTDPNGAVPRGLFDRALSTVAAAIGADGYVDEGGSIPNSFRQRVLEQIAEGLAALLNLTAANVSTLSPTFTRASAAYEIDGVGVLASRAVDVLRDDHYISGERTILLEAQRTNGWTYSEQLDNAVWTKDGVTIIANATTAPDGAATADKVVESAALANHRIYASPPSHTAGSKQAVSFFAQAAGREWVQIQTNLSGGSIPASWVNISTGALGTVAAAHSIKVGAIDAHGYRRVTVVVTPPAGEALTFVQAWLATADGGGAYTGDGTSGIYLWGMEFEADQPFASSYIKTEAATASRAVDSLSVPFTAAPQEMTVYCRFREQGTAQTVGGRVLQIGNVAPRFGVYLDGRYRAFHDGTGGTVQSTTTGLNLPAVGDLVELVARLYADGSVEVVQSINGAAEVTGARSAVSALQASYGSSDMFIGSASGANQGFNAFRNVLVLPGTKSLAECRAKVGA